MPCRCHPAHAPSSVILRDPEGILRILKSPGFCNTRAGLRYAVLAFGTRDLAFATQATRDFGLTPGVCYTDGSEAAVRDEPGPALYGGQYPPVGNTMCKTKCVGGLPSCKPRACVHSAAATASLDTAIAVTVHLNRPATSIEPVHTAKPSSDGRGRGGAMREQVHTRIPVKP